MYIEESNQKKPNFFVNYGLPNTEKRKCSFHLSNNLISTSKIIIAALRERSFGAGIAIMYVINPNIYRKLKSSGI